MKTQGDISQCGDTNCSFNKKVFNRHTSIKTSMVSPTNIINYREDKEGVKQKKFFNVFNPIISPPSRVSPLSLKTKYNDDDHLTDLYREWMFNRNKRQELFTGGY